MFWISLLAGKLYDFLTRKFEKSDRCGMVSLKLYDNFLRRVAKPKIVIVTTGTNGKTTTNNLLCNALENLGYSVACNKEGYNVRPGIARALMRKTTIFNKTKADIAVLEADELSLDVILDQVKCNYLIVTNLSSDTLIRNGHPYYVFNQMEKSIPSYTKLILNREDMISSLLMKEKGNERIFYSIEKQDFEKDESNTILQDAKICPICHELLTYDFVRYHHIGFAHCKKCGYKNEEAKYTVSKIDNKNESFTLNNNKYNLVKGSGIFNVYNLASIIAVLTEIGIDNKSIQSSISNLKIGETRYSEETIKNKKIITTMLKGGNPLSVCRAFDYAANIGKKTNIILILDDQHEIVKNGMFEYMPYLYASDYELLNNDNIDKIIIGGKLSYDQKLRLLMAGVEEEKMVICEKEEDTKDYIDYENAKNIVILHDLYCVDIKRKLVESIKEKLI